MVNVKLLIAGVVGGLLLVGCGGNSQVDEELSKVKKSLKGMNVEVGQIETFVEKCYDANKDNLNKLIKKANAKMAAYGSSRDSAYGDVVVKAFDTCALIKGAEYTMQTAQKTDSLAEAIANYLTLKFDSLYRANSASGSEKNPYTENVGKTKAEAVKLNIDTGKLESYASKCYSSSQAELEQIANVWHNGNILENGRGSVYAGQMRNKIKDMCALTDNADYIKKVSETNATLSSAAYGYINAIIMEKFHDNLVNGKLVADKKDKK